MRLPDIDTRRLSGLKYKLVSCFELAADMVGGGIGDFVNDADGPAFLGLGVDGTGTSEITTMKVNRCPFIHFESI